MGTVNQTVEDSIGDGGIADVRMPFVNGQLAGNDGGSATVTVIDDLQQVAPLLRGEWGQAPVVEGSGRRPRTTWTRARFLSMRA